VETISGDGNPYLSLTSFGRGVLALGAYRFDPEGPFVSGVMVSFDGFGWSYPETPFADHLVDDMVSNGSSVVALALSGDEFGDQHMWRADLSEL
jgi:hypothetical protein